MARIACIAKYPPLEGGMAAKAFWLTRALAERGHAVHVVTDWAGVDEVHSVAADALEPLPADITVHRAERNLPWIIPSDPHRVMSLLEKTLEVVRSHRVEIIAASYLVPYGLVGWMAGKITGLPFVLGHGGSDLHKFVLSGVWPALWKEAFSAARAVITDPENRREIERWCSRIRVTAPYVPDPKAFSAEGRRQRERPVLALLGKANYHWRHKGWHRVIDTWASLGDGFDYLICSQGLGLENFRAYVETHLRAHVTWRAFVPPWRMPELLRQVDGLFHFETDLPFPTFSNLALEALWCGATIIVDRPDLLGRYRTHGIELSEVQDHVLAVPPQDPSVAARLIETHFNSRRGLEPRSDRLGGASAYHDYVLANESCLLSALAV